MRTSPSQQWQTRHRTGLLSPTWGHSPITMCQWGCTHVMATATKRLTHYTCCLERTVRSWTQTHSYPHILKLKSKPRHLVSSVQFQVVLHMASGLSLLVPARWTWPGCLLSFLTGSSFTTAWSFGILLTTWISHHRQTTSTSHIWGSTRTTESWCKLTHVSALETTAVSHSTSLRWRMVRRMIEGKGEKAGFPFIFSRSSRQEFDEIQLFLSSFPPHYGSGCQLIMLHWQVLWCHILPSGSSTTVIMNNHAFHAMFCFFLSHLHFPRFQIILWKYPLLQFHIKWLHCHCLYCFPPYQLQTHHLSSYMPGSYQTLRWSCHDNHHLKPIQTFSITLSEFGEFLKLLLSVILPSTKWVLNLWFHSLRNESTQLLQNVTGMSVIISVDSKCLQRISLQLDHTGRWSFDLY